MRFDLLFDDLEAQLETQLASDDGQRQLEEERLRAARTVMRDRIAALVAAEAAGIRVQLLDGTAVELTPTAVGRDWFAAERAGGGEAVVPLTAVASLGLDAASVSASRERVPVPPHGDVSARIGIGVVLRDLARRRIALDVLRHAERAPLHGTIDRVGVDHFDLAVHERGTVRREATVREHRVVALSSVVLLRL